MRVSNVFHIFPYICNALEIVGNLYSRWWKIQGILEFLNVAILTSTIMEAMMKKERRCFSSLEMLEKREIGQQRLRTDTLTSKYYKYFKISGSQDEKHDAIFNLEFSPSGKTLVAACEASAILLYDPIHKKCLHSLPNAHNDSVNCICYCDERIFASGSDDCTIALWDARKLNEPIMKLSGHTGWVKSLAYHNQTGLLLSSAFDGTVRGWDINRYSSSREDLKGTMFVHKKSLSRMGITPEGDKLILSCSDCEPNDTILIVHNLDLPNFAENFTENSSDQMELRSVDNTNIVETLDRKLEYPKFPACIASFQIHPYGSCLVSRYLTLNDPQFTTVHDIQTCSYGSERRRLSHYIQESDSGRGFIKELGFSPDGRIIASPFAHGTRLLAFDPDCSQWRKDSEVKTLSEIKFLLGHSMPVCCSKFSPSHVLLATGCLGGKIAFHEPRL